MIVDFLNGKMVGSVDTGLNVVHVRDVARGHILAAEKGRVGERYILGHRNLSLLEIFQMLSTLTGVPAPRFRVPYAVAWMAAAAMEGVSLRHAPPARGPPHRGPHVPQAHVLQRAKAIRSSACPRPRPRPPCTTRWPGSPPRLRARQTEWRSAHDVGIERDASATELGECGGHFWAPAYEELEELDG